MVFTKIPLLDVSHFSLYHVNIKLGVTKLGLTPWGGAYSSWQPRCLKFWNSVNVTFFLYRS